MDKLKSKLRELFGIDVRSLALFRIGLALILLWDLAMRVQDLKAHYTDEGIMPRSVLVEKIVHPWTLSLHLANGTWEFQLVLFVLAALFALALLFGYKTRLMTFLSWAFVISLQSRNPLNNQGGDIVLRLLLFWAMFLPLGACWSLDQRLSKKSPPQNQIVSGGTFALLMQVCFIYWFAAILKLDPAWTTNGTAIWYALSIEQFATPFGNYLLNYPSFLRIATFLTLYFEGFGPLFAFSPIWTGPIRMATVVCFILFHLLGLNLAMELTHFSYVCAIGWLVFIPEWFWNRVLKWPASTIVPWKASWLSNILAIFFLMFVFVWNTRSLNKPTFHLPPLVNAGMDNIGMLLRIDQYWNMFSPFPIREDGWYVIPGKLRDGTEVDLFKDGAPLTWDKPPLLSATYKNDRWRSYMINLWFFDEDREVLLPIYADYLCRQWNMNHEYSKQLLSFDIDFMLKINNIEEPPMVPEKVVMWQQQCAE